MSLHQPLTNQGSSVTPLASVVQVPEHPDGLLVFGHEQQQVLGVLDIVAGEAVGLGNACLGMVLAASSQVLQIVISNM